MSIKQHTISLHVVNSPGVLVRIATMFARRGFNIDSLVVSPALDGKFSRMTITAEGDTAILDQIIKQCAKLVDVVSAQEHDPTTTLEKEFALLKIKTSDKNRVEVLQVLQHIHAETLDLTDKNVIVQLCGNPKDLDNSIQMVEKYGIIEMVRTGKVLIAKGAEHT